MSASPSSPVAYLLVYHGSRDPRPAQATERLAQFVRAQLEDQPLSPVPTQAKASRSRFSSNYQSQFERLPAAIAPTSKGSVVASVWPYSSHPALVGTACLETGALSLHQQIIDFGQRVYAAGVRSICIVPLFLLKGIHVLDDIPAEVQLAQRSLPGLSLKVCAHLGSHPDLKGLVQAKLQSTAADTWLLLAHGSRRPGGNKSIQALAQSLGGTTAYWSVPPSLETQVIQLIQRGVQQLAILPYFLFMGTTTDAVTQRTEELAERFPKMGFHLLPPLGPSPELANLVVDLALGRLPVKSQPVAAPLKRVAFRHQIQTSSLVS